MWMGVGFAMMAGLLWGGVFVGPNLLPEYAPVALVAGRYIAFGVVSVVLAWGDRAELRQLTRADWFEALRLAVVGNLLYYLLLATAIQRAGTPLPTMIIGALPVVIAVTANLQHSSGVGAHLPWRRLWPALLAIAAGIACVNQAELAALSRPEGDGPEQLALGAVLAVGALVCWTWYPLRNGDWLRAHPHRSARVWATAQGLATLPLAIAGYAGWLAWTAGSADFAPLGPRPAAFVALAAATGLLSSWVAMLCWNAASRRVAPALLGQLIVFETLAALLYAFLLRGAWPPALTLVGAGLLVAGVCLGLRARS